MHQKIYLQSNSAAHDKEDLFRLHMIFAIGAISLNRKLIHATAATDYYLAALKNKRDFLSTASVANVQNILLLLLFALEHELGGRYNLTSTKRVLTYASQLAINGIWLASQCECVQSSVCTAKAARYFNLWSCRCAAESSGLLTLMIGIAVPFLGGLLLSVTDIYLLR